MKKALYSLLIAVLLSACSDGGGSDDSGGGGMAEPANSNCSLEICRNSWMDRGTSNVGDYFVFRFTESTITASNVCHNGLIAKITVSARVTASTLQVLKSAKKRVSRNGQWCEIKVSPNSVSYSIFNGQLHAGGSVLTRY